MGLITKLFALCLCSNEMNTQRMYRCRLEVGSFTPEQSVEDEWVLNRPPGLIMWKISLYTKSCSECWCGISAKHVGCMPPPTFHGAVLI
jgi:hypothetical protein